MYYTTVWESHPERAELPGVEVSGHVHKAKFVRKINFRTLPERIYLKKEQVSSNIGKNTEILDIL